MSGSVHVPFYATVFRGDQLHSALEEFAAISMHYGATGYVVYRYRDDKYKMLLSVDFETKDQWDNYWNGPEAIDFRIANQSYYQVPLLYGWVDVTTDAATALAD